MLFNRASLVVVDTQAKMGDVRTLRMSKIELPPGSPPSVAYDPIGDNGFTKTMEFARHDDSKRKLVLTEKSSKKISKRARLVCGRDESTEITRKIYRYQREDEPVRNITMQCREYELSTRGGRKGCGD